LNVGETDRAKNGFSLTTDKFAAAEGDLYDDTHAIFSTGLIDGLQMASLTKGLGTETYNDPRFAGAGPIDCMYVVGKQSGDFTLAKKSSQTFGSDHFAASTRFLFSGTAPTPVGGGDITGLRIAALLPNPDGPDVGHEWVKLKNFGTDAVTLEGWKLRDEADNAVTLSGTIAGGAELTVSLASGQMPLNNGGDEIEFLDAAGNSVQVVNYSEDQVSSGQVIQIVP
jgi:hypothetical protein